MHGGRQAVMLLHPPHKVSSRAGVWGGGGVCQLRPSTWPTLYSPLPCSLPPSLLRANISKGAASFLPSQIWKLSLCCINSLAFCVSVQEVCPLEHEALRCTVALAKILCKRICTNDKDGHRLVPVSVCV